MSNELLRNLPAVSKLLEKDQVRKYFSKLPRAYVIETVRNILAEAREDIKKGKVNSVCEEEILKKIKASLSKGNYMSLKRVINATGVILHTNLGRAVLSENAQKAVQEIIKGYSNIELNLKTGKRGSRYTHVEEILCKITGAESAMVVNNNAAAVMLVLNTLAKDKEVIVSRGQLVEIGGSFRVPDVMEASGAKLIEVGTTNKTYISDYEKAITEDTAALLKVHTSNFKVIGFTHEATSDELVELGRKKGIPVIEDLGSGFLIDLSEYNITDEPVVSESLKAGIDVVTFSGDKLLGGPQAGIIVGKKEYIELFKKNPLTRALRVDKMTFAALEATLWEYIDKEFALKNNPTLSRLIMDKNKILEKAKLLEEELKKAVGDKVHIEIIEGFSKAGGGSLPSLELPTYLVSLWSDEFSVEKIAEKLRSQTVPVIARISDARLNFDPRTISPEEIPLLVNSVREIF